MYHSGHSALTELDLTTLPVEENDGSATSRGMKLRDSLDRRLRLSPRQPKKSITLTERDYLIFEIINRHGPLPSTYLFQLTRHISHDETGFKKRLRDLYHGTKWMGDHIAFLSKPKWQEDNKLAYWQHLIYDLTNEARERLRRKGILVTNREAEHPLHLFMGACVTASLKIFIESRLLEYHDLYKILCHDKCPQKTRELDNPLAVLREPDKDEKLYDKKNRKIEHTLIPDHFFAIQGDTVHPTFFAVEIDRGTETTQDTSRTSLGRKFIHYDKAIETGAFENHFGFPRTKRANLKVLLITNSRHRRDNLARYYKKHGKYPDQFLFTDTQPYDYDYGWIIPPLHYFTWKDGKGDDTQLV